MFEDNFFLISIFLGVISSLILSAFSKSYRIVGIITLFLISISISGGFISGFLQILLVPGRMITLVPIFSWMSIALSINLLIHSKFLSSHFFTKTLKYSFKEHYFLYIAFTFLTILSIPNLTGYDYELQDFRLQTHRNLDFSLYKIGSTESYGYMEPYMPGLIWLSQNAENSIIFDIDPSTSRHFRSPFEWAPTMKFLYLINKSPAPPNLILDNDDKVELKNSLLNPRNPLYSFDNLVAKNIDYILIINNDSTKKILRNLESYPFLENSFTDDYVSIYYVDDVHYVKFEKLLNKLLLEAKTAEQNNDYHSQIQALTSLISLDKFNSEFYFERAVAYEKVNDYQLAFSDYEMAMRINPYYDFFDDVHYIEIEKLFNKLLLEAKTSEQNNDFLSASKLYFSVLINSSELDGNLFLKLFKIYYYNLEDEKKAMNLFDTIEENFNLSTYERIDNIHVYYIYGLKISKELGLNNDYRSQIQALTSLISFDKFNSEFYFERAVAYEKVNDYRLSVSDYEMAMRLNSDYDFVDKINYLQLKID